MKQNRIVIPVIAVLLAAALGGCNGRTEAAPIDPKPATPTAAEPTPSAGAVARIVFVGQKEACECTRTRIEETFAALESALEGGPALPVERLQLDVDKEKVAALTAKRPLMVAPGLYLLDDKGEIVDFLQGELDAAQIIGALR